MWVSRKPSFRQSEGTSKDCKCLSDSLARNSHSSQADSVLTMQHPCDCDTGPNRAALEQPARGRQQRSSAACERARQPGQPRAQQPRRLAAALARGRAHAVAAPRWGACMLVKL